MMLIESMYTNPLMSCRGRHWVPVIDDHLVAYDPCFAVFIANCPIKLI